MDGITDVRTTPRWLRVPAVAVTGLLAGYMFISYRIALANLGVAQEPAGIAEVQDLFWLGKWRMFTELRDTHTDMEVQALVGATWVFVNLPVLYPSHWTEGPGYLRDDFYESRGRLTAFAQDICERQTGATELTFTLLVWPKTPGQVYQPRDEVVRTSLLEYTCGSWQKGTEVSEPAAAEDPAARDGRGEGRGGGRGGGGRGGGRGEGRGGGRGEPGFGGQEGRQRGAPGDPGDQRGPGTPGQWGPR